MPPQMYPAVLCDVHREDMTMLRNSDSAQRFLPCLDHKHRKCLSSSLAWICELIP